MGLSGRRVVKSRPEGIGGERKPDDVLVDYRENQCLIDEGATLNALAREGEGPKESREKRRKIGFELQPFVRGK